MKAAVQMMLQTRSVLCLIVVLGLVSVAQSASLGQGSWGQSRQRGANVGLWLSAQDLRVLKSWGANHVRAQIQKFDLVDNKYGSTFTEDGWQQLDAFLQRAHAVGLRVVLDFHSHGDFFPDQNWRATAQTAWDDPLRRRRFATLWHNIASHYRDDREIIAGYDILNEPHPPYTDAGYAAWNSVAKEVTSSIREVDDYHTIVIECASYANPSGMAKLNPTGDANTIYSFHAYVPHEFTEQGTRPQWPFGQTYPGIIGLGWDRKTPTKVDKTWLEKALRPVVDFQMKHKTCIWVGEFSARRDAPEESARRYLRDVVGIFEKYRWNWCYHAFREDPVWSLECCSDSKCRRRHKITPRLTLMKKYWSRNATLSRKTK